MHNITDYLKLVKLGKIKALGQRCENEKGYYCVIENEGNLVPAIVKIDGENVTIFPTKQLQNHMQENGMSLSRK